MSQWVEAGDAGDLISTLNVVWTFYIESDLICFPWSSITVSSVVWGCPSETYPTYFWLIACCSFKRRAWRNATLFCLTQMVPCDSSYYHYPYKTLHVEAGTVTFWVFMCLPALWVMPCLHCWRCTAARAPFHRLYHIEPGSDCVCEKTGTVLWTKSSALRVPAVLCAASVGMQMNFSIILKQRGATPSTSACSAFCQLFVFLSNTFTGCHLSLHGCGGGTCWAPRNESNRVEEKWLTVNVICQCGKCNGKGMNSQFLLESSSSFSPPTIGIFVAGETSLLHLLPPWPHLSTISFVQTRFFWSCHPRSLMSLTLPGCWRVPGISTENLVGLYLSDFPGEMSHAVTGTA